MFELPAFVVDCQASRARVRGGLQCGAADSKRLQSHPLVYCMRPSGGLRGAMVMILSEAESSCSKGGRCYSRDSFAPEHVCGRVFLAVFWRF